MSTVVETGRATVVGNAVLDVRQLRVNITGTTIDVIDDVSVSLAPGEILGLVGESGSGKTTLALALLGFARQGTEIVGGSVFVDGTDILTLSPKELRAVRGGLVSYVPQDPASWLNPSMRLRTQLTEILECHDFRSSKSARAQRLAEMLEEVNLPQDDDFLSRYPHQLSGGQQQRVAIAMAFANRPRVVVLDEPATGLDVTTQAQVIRTVRDLAQVHRVAAVYVSHDLAVVAGLAVRVGVMYAGRLVEIGEAGVLFRMAAHPYTRRLLEAVPDPHRRRHIVGIPGRVAPLGARPPGCSFADRCSYADEGCRTGSIDEVPVPGTEAHLVRCRRWSVVRSVDRPGRVDDTSVAAAGTAKSAMILELNDLVAWYGSTEVLHHATLAIPRGHCLALVGESGSGKTTLSRCIGGLHTEARGELRFGGETLPWGAGNRSPEIREAIQYVFQNPDSSLNPRKTVAELLRQPLKHFGLDSDRHHVIELLEHVALTQQYADRFPAQLSGGERQRVAIARALAVSPKLLICDEITSALDVSVQASILQLLERLRTEFSLTMLFVTHNLAIVRTIADDVIVLQEGEIVERGTVDDVLDRPQAPYTQTLLRDTPALV